MTHFDFKGRVTQTVDVLGNPTNSVFDARDQVIKTTNPDGTISDTVYDSEGRAAYTDDPHVSGQATVRGTHMIYDSMGRVIETDRLDNIVITVSTSNGVSSSQVTSVGNVVSITRRAYNDLRQVTQSTDAANQPTAYQYDAAGRETAVTDALSHTTQTGYDLAGRETSTTDALSHTTQHFYDADGKETKTVFADGSVSQAGYDALGRKTSATDQMGRVTDYQYEPEGHLTAVLLPYVYDPVAQKTTQPETQYAYDVYGDMTQITDANGHVTQFTFDQFGHQLSRTLPMGQSESTTYDAYGREASHFDFKNQKETFHYDSLGRVDTKTFYAAGSSTAGETVVSHFDSLGRNDTVTDTIGSTVRSTTNGFDLDNRVTSITTPEGTVNYVFDSATGFHKETYTTNSDIVYTPDALQRVMTVTVNKQNGTTLGTPLVTNYFYTAVGNVDHITYPNGTETDYAYDELNRLKSVTNKLGSTVLSSYVYTLEADGFRTGVTETDSTGTVTKTWTYDALQRLTQEAVTVTGSPGYSSYTDQYTYDLVGNRLSKTDTAGSQTLASTDAYNANDQLTTETGTLNGASSYSTTYGDDANGSLTSVSRTGSNAETDTYTFDLQNRLLTANISRTENSQSVTIAASYNYDDSGPRAQSVVTTTIGSGSPTTTTTQYLVDSTNPTGYTQVLEEHTNGSGTPSVSYLLGLSVFGQTDSNGTRYFMPDAQGSTRQLVDASGNIVARFAYDAYGNALGTQLGVVNPPPARILYVNQQFDTGLGYYYNRARCYATSTGRFTSMDSSPGRPVTPVTLHKYIYANADPTNGIDPSGNETLIGAMISMAIDLVVSALELMSIQHLVKQFLYPKTPITAAQVPTFHKDLAELNYDAYKNNPIGWKEWRPVANGTFKRGSFFAALYQHQVTKSYVLAFRGTDDLEDWWTNIAQGLVGPLADTQYQEAADLAVRVDQQLGQGADLTMTGHSLGGGLASAASMATGRSAVTFNAAELNYMWLTQRGFPPRATVNYSVAGEVLTGAQDFSLLLVPAWQRFELEPGKEDARADPITLHKMPAVLHALELPVPGL